MALILIKQEFSSALTHGAAIYKQWFFNNLSYSVEIDYKRGFGMEPYEMSTGQLIFAEGTVEYRYDGNGGFTSNAEPAEKVWPFFVTIGPEGGGTATDLTNASPYAEGAVVSLSAVPNAGYVFVSWTKLGAVISTDANFIYSIPFDPRVLVANFTPFIPHTPEPIPTRFYDLELRVNGAQIPISGLVQRTITGIFSSDMEGDRSYPVNVPMTPALLIALGNPDDPQSKTDFSKPFPAELWSHGNRLYSAYLDILKSDERQIRATLILDSAFFIFQNKAITLPDCYADDAPISIADQIVYAVGGYLIGFFFQKDIRIKVNSTTRIFFKSQYENHILMLEAVYDWLIGLGLGLEVTLEYSEDLTDEQSQIRYWDTTVVTETTIEGYYTNPGQWRTSRSFWARNLTSKRFQMEPWNQASEENRIAFPSIYNRELYEGNNSLHDGIVNRYDSAGRLYVSNLKYLTFAESFRWEHTIIPFLYLSDVVKTVFRSLNISVSGEAFFADPRVKAMMLYNNRTLDYVQVRDNVTPVPRTIANLQEGQNRTNTEAEYVTNYWYENIHDLEIKLRNHVPEVSVVSFLKAMKNYLGLKYDFNILQNRVDIRFIRDIIRQREVLDFTKKAGRVYVLTHSKETGLAFTYENPDPLMSDGANPPPSGGVGGGPDYTVQNYLALDALDAEIAEIALVQSLRAYFQLTTNQDESPYWKLYAFIQQDGPPSGGQGGDSPSGGRGWNVGMVPLVDSYTAGRKMPAIECTANNPEVNLTNKECGIRIFGFYGQQLDGADQPYAFGSCTRYDAKELESENQFDLDIRSADNSPFWKDLENLIDRGKPYETNLLLESTDFIKLSRTPIIRIANIDYLIDENEVQHSTKEHSIAKVKLWKIK